MAASALAFPVFASSAVSQEQQTDKSKQKEKDNKPTRVPCQPEGGIAPHEPPIGFEGGSLIIDVPKTNKIDVITTVPSDDRPHKHTLGSANYTGIQEVKVLTRIANGFPSYTRYELPLVTGPSPYQLRIWLVQLKRDSGDLEDQYEAIASGAKPHLLLKPTSPQIETQHRLNQLGFSHKPHVPYRYEYPSFGKHFRIGQWQITDSAGTIVKDEAGNRFEGKEFEQYNIYVSFYHA
jgi:hypothetical protein